MSEVQAQPLELEICFSAEPGIYLAEQFGVRIASILAVIENGGQRFDETLRRMQIVA